MRKDECEALLEEIVRTQNRLRGRLCGLIESWGLDPKREAAMISTLKSVSYDNEQKLKDTLREMLLEELDREARHSALCGAREE